MGRRTIRLALPGLTGLMAVLLLARTSATATSALAAATAAVTAQAAGQGVSAAQVQELITKKFNTVDMDLALWAIQPNLGRVMMEYSNRMARVWFAANADNWDMAKYQVGEMTEIQEVGETTEPDRATLLKTFEDGFLKPLDKAIDSKDKTAFKAAYDKAITGCNACHTAASEEHWASHKFIVIKTPTIEPASYIDWKGAGQGNYIANPPAATTAATAVSTPALTGLLDAAGVEAMLNAKFNTVDTSLALWNIQPGLGTIMMEYSNRISRVYFAQKAGNWDMAKYQVGQMTEIQAVGETTRPSRAPLLKAFEASFLKPLDKAIDSKDSKTFDTAYTAAIRGCNACHAASKAPEWKSYQFIKVQVPTADDSDYVHWAAKKGTGNYIANPPAETTEATAVATPAPTAPLDMAGVEAIVNAKFNTLDTDLALWSIQRGLGTVMMEYSNRMAQIWYAANADNWDMAKHQIDGMMDIQAVGETTEPDRAPLLKAFENGFLVPMDKAIVGKDKTAFKAAYAKTITGCNACHAAAKEAEWASFAFVEFQQPTTDPASFVQWKTAGGTGNYKP